MYLYNSVSVQMPSTAIMWEEAAVEAAAILRDFHSMIQALESLETLDSPHDVDLDSAMCATVQQLTVERSSRENAFLYWACLIFHIFSDCVSYCLGINVSTLKNLRWQILQTSTCSVTY